VRIESRLNAARFPYPHVVYRYQGAGHHVNALVPYEPGEGFADLIDPLGEGDTLFANADADARLWPRLLSFLASRIPQDRKRQYRVIWPVVVHRCIAPLVSRSNRW